MSEGSRIRDSWSVALADAQSRFRSLLAASSSPQWKRIPIAPTVPKADSAAVYQTKGKSRAFPTVTDVVVHRRLDKDGEVYRAMLDVPAEEHALVDLDGWKAVLQTPEVRKSWDPMVQGSHLVELLDADTRIVKTEFTLGWPANPRDAIVISRTFSDSSTIIDISTSLPRSSDDPAYLRPSPPYVRSQVHLSSWCIQTLPNSSPPADGSSKATPAPRIRVTCFWQHDLNAVWGMGGPGIGQHLPSLLIGLIDTMREKGDRIPRLIGYGFGISVFSIAFGEAGREALMLEYAIIMSEDDELEPGGPKVKSLEDVLVQKEKRRLERTVEIALPSMHGWDVQISVKAPSEETASAPWTVRAGLPSERDEPVAGRLLFRLSHPRPPPDHIVSVKVVAELTGGSPGLRVNNRPQEIEILEPRDPTSFAIDKGVLGDVASIQGLSLHTANTTGSTSSETSASAYPNNNHPIIRSGTERAPAAEKTILIQVRRNYIYFTSLLQEPEAKWRPITEARGVTVTQLDSIDPTLVVYRAEAVFVGLGLWDLFGAIDTPGARTYWDKGFEDASLLEDVNELTELWHFKTRAAWPASARDSVILKTSYKSPASVHLFSFSTDDTQLFPSIPPPELAVIRSQIDLQGWAIEALSPTTTQITLLDQSDPKGWSNKAYIPGQMIATVAGIGEFAIKCGSPPVVSRLAGAKVVKSKYEHDKAVLRVEYEASDRGMAQLKPLDGAVAVSTMERSGDTDISTIPRETVTTHAGVPKIECELRVDVDSWASNIEIVVDPPPQSVSCLRRHRLASDGGGLWVAIEHDSVVVEDERLLAQVRKGPGGIKEKAVVMVNGTKVKVTVVDLPESEVRMRSRKKRVKPTRMPLDQPPVREALRRRPTESWETDPDTAISRPRGSRMSLQPFASPIAKYFSMAVEQAASSTTAAAAAASAAMASTPASLAGVDSSPLSSPVQAALQALSTLRALHSTPLADWTPVSEKGALSISRKLTDVSPSIPVHRAEKVIEGVCAEDVANIVADLSCRKQWDDRFDSGVVLEEYGYGCMTAFITGRTSFPFQNRGFLLASTSARAASRPSDPLVEAPHRTSGGTSTPPHSPVTIYHATASFSPSSVSPAFSLAKCNPTNLAIGRVLLQGWVMETLDPYATENYAIPSTRVTHFVAIDFAGALPVAVNSMINAALPRVIIGLQNMLKNHAPVPALRWPAKSLRISHDDNDNIAAKEGWVLDDIDQQRTLLSHSFSPSTKFFQSTILIKPRTPQPPTRPPSPTEPIPATPSNATLKVPRRARVPSSGPSPASSSSVAFPSAPPSPAPFARTDATITPGLESPSLHMHSRTLSKPSAFRGTRVLSNAGRLADGKIAGDFVVAELILDAELYPTGYSVTVSSELLPERKPGSPLDLAAKPTGDQPSLNGDFKLTDGDTTSTTELYSPVAASSTISVETTVYTIPPSALHSHSLDPSTSERAPKHLLRFTLPTFCVSTDAGGQRPLWLKEVEEQGAVVWLSVTASETGKVVVNKNPVDVVSEKKSSDALGTELENNRVGKMAVLKRIEGSPGEILPKELRKPLAVAKSLFDEPVDVPPPDRATTPTAQEVGDDKQLGDADKAMVIVPEGARPKASTSQTLLRFFNSNGLLRIPAMSAFVGSPARTQPSSPTRPGELRTRSEIGQLTIATHLQRRYSLQFVLVTGLISFLLGSLIRSLLSPADFMYAPLPTDPVRMAAGASDGEHGPDAHGWREVKRLVEIKWLVWGWDAVIFAVVRRR